MTLTSNLYLLSRDKELRESIKKISVRFLEKFDSVFAHDTESKINSALSKSEELADLISVEEMRRIVKFVYRKLRIASTAEMNRLEQQLAEIRRELALAEARIIAFENSRKHHSS